MAEIKQLFSPDSVTVAGADDVEKVAEYPEMNEAQAQKLRELFAQSTG